MPNAFALAAQYAPEGMQVEQNRTFVIETARGKADLRSRLVEVFNSADTRGVPNGLLDYKELEHRLNIADLKLAVEGVDAVLDANGDGSISLTEIVNAMDKNMDGQVTLKEFQDTFTSMLAQEEAEPDVGNPYINLIFDAMDANKNGAVTKIEFLDWLRVHKPKKGEWSKLPKLLEAFNLHKRPMITKADFQDAFKAAKGLEVASFQIEEGTLFASKVDICTAFCLNLANQGAAAYASEDCMFNPPGAPAMPLGDVLGMMGAMKKAFPDWHSVVSSCVENGDGTVTAITQQCIGTMQADLPAMGPFPAVNLADAPARCKATSAALPREIGTYTFSEDGMKVASGAYEGKVEEGGDPTPWLLEKWNVKGDLSDVGFGILFAWLGK